MRIALFTGSSPGNSPVYADAARALAEHLADQGIGIVYGGATVGLMGVVADSALARGGEVYGVIPQGLMDRELAHHGLTSLDVVATMHERKARMAELADAFVALPGGAGTLEELFEVWTWQQLGIHHKPVCLYDTDGYWQPLLTAIEQMAGAGFLAARYRDAILVEREPVALLERISGWQPRESTWSEPTPPAP